MDLTEQAISSASTWLNVWDFLHMLQLTVSKVHWVSAHMFSFHTQEQLFLLAFERARGHKFKRQMYVTDILNNSRQSRQFHTAPPDYQRNPYVYRSPLDDNSDLVPSRSSYQYRTIRNVEQQDHLNWISQASSTLAQISSTCYEQSSRHNRDDAGLSRRSSNYDSDNRILPSSVYCDNEIHSNHRDRTHNSPRREDRLFYPNFTRYWRKKKYNYNFIFYMIDRTCFRLIK